MQFDPMPLEERLKHIEQSIINSLLLWPLPEGAKVRLINVSENATYLVEAPAFRSILRVHRPGYHSRRGIEQELAWSKALSEAGAIITPAPIAGVDGEFVQVLNSPGLPEPHFTVMFEFAEGRHPDEREDLIAPFERLGAIAARLHEHSRNWEHPERLERLTWDADTVLGPRSTWGNWRDAPNVTADIRDVLEKAERLIKSVWTLSERRLIATASFTPTCVWPTC